MFKKLKRIWQRFYQLIIQEELILHSSRIIVPEWVGKQKQYRELLIHHTTTNKCMVMMGTIIPDTECLPIQNNTLKPKMYSYDKT